MKNYAQVNKICAFLKNLPVVITTTCTERKKGLYSKILDHSSANQNASFTRIPDLQYV